MAKKEKTEKYIFPRILSPLCDKDFFYKDSTTERKYVYNYRTSIAYMHLTKKFKSGFDETFDTQPSPFTAFL